MSVQNKKLFYFVTEDWYFVSHRLPLAIAAKNAGYNVGVVTRVRSHGEIIRSSGLRLIPFENSRTGINPFQEVVTLIRLILLFRRERPDIIHNVAIKPVLYGSIAAKLSKSSHIVNALAGMGWIFSSSSGAARWVKPIARIILRNILKSGITLVQNPDDANLLAGLGVPKANIRRIAGAGVDLNRFHPEPALGNDITIVLPARLLWDKGVGEYVNAARQLKQEGVKARFLIAGQPDHANPSSISRDQINEWVSEGVVEYLGWVDDVPNLLAACHIVCLPSYYGEGIPKSLIEAAAAGKPIVTTDMPGCREIVHHNDNGLLVPPRQVKPLAEALGCLIKDPILRERLGTRGRHRAETEFGMNTITEQTLALYAEASI